MQEAHYLASIIDARRPASATSDSKKSHTIQESTHYKQVKLLKQCAINRKDSVKTSVKSKHLATRPYRANALIQQRS
jgi:hypothetical protein